MFKSHSEKTAMISFVCYRFFLNWLELYQFCQIKNLGSSSFYLCLEYLRILKIENCKQIPASFELFGLLDTHNEDYISKKITAVNHMG